MEYLHQHNILNNGISIIPSKLLNHFFDVVWTKPKPKRKRILIKWIKKGYGTKKKPKIIFFTQGKTAYVGSDFYDEVLKSIEDKLK